MPTANKLTTDQAANKTTAQSRVQDVFVQTGGRSELSLGEHFELSLVHESKY